MFADVPVYLKPKDRNSTAFSMGSSLVARDAVVVPLIVAPQGFSTRAQGHVRASLREAHGVVAVVALVDLVEDTVQVLTPNQQADDAAEDLLAMVRGLL